MSEHRGDTTAGPSAPGDESWDRRLFARVGVLEHRAWLAWSDDSGESRVPVRLLDVGLGGVAVECDAEPPAGRELWFWLHDPAGPQCAGVEVVSLSQGRRARYLARLAFFEPCPDRLYRTAVDGIRGEPRPGPDSRPPDTAASPAGASPAHQAHSS